MEAADGRTDLPMPEQNQIQIGATGSGTFDSILYTTPGDYEYHIRQLSGTDQNITYDATEYDVTVRVTNAENGGLEDRNVGSSSGAIRKTEPDHI